MVIVGDSDVDSDGEDGDGCMGEEMSAKEGRRSIRAGVGIYTEVVMQ